MEATLNHGQAGKQGGAAAAAAAAVQTAGSGDTETHSAYNGSGSGSGPNDTEYEAATDSLTRSSPAVTMPPPYWQNMASRARAASVQSSDSSGRPTGAILLLDHEADDDAQDRNNACWARSVEIVDYTVVNGGATSIGAFVVWNVRVETLQGSYMNIRKRYSEFDTLRYRLMKSFPNFDAAVPSLPPKSVISKFRPKFLEKRRAGLQYFLKDHNDHELPLPCPVAAGATAPPSAGYRSLMAASYTTPLSPATDSIHNEYMASLVPPTMEKFHEIAQIQTEKEGENRRKMKEHQRLSTDPILPLEDQQGQDAAARMIQKTFRGYRARREMDGYSINPSTRWVAAVRDAQFRETHRPRPRPLSAAATVTGEVQPPAASARHNWRKAGMVAFRAGRDASDSESDSESDSADATPEVKAAKRQQRQVDNAKRRTEARTMGLQYFLEMIDVKHRYGSNLRIYHEEWKRSNAQENFLYWLDYGAGRNVELDACPREQLEREQVRYLSREERQYYLVKVDAEGKLCWAKNGARIDTTEQFKDSIHGIVPADDATPAFRPSANPLASTSDSDSDSSIESKREADRANKYATPEFDNASGVKKIHHLSTSTIINKLLRKSVRKNCWIFVADTNFRLYIGIKDSGAFQHSSFLQGGRISAAGLIKIKNGRLQSLSPLSGHYRPPSSNFRAFLQSLKAENVDMSHLTISKSYAVLLGLETYVKTTKKSKNFVDKLLRTRDKAAEDTKPAQKAMKKLSMTREN